MTKSNKPPVFKDYHQHQVLLLPPSFDELIAPNHAVRVVNSVIEQLDLGALLKKYKGGGASSYHPRMLLKILTYGYLCNIYSSRKLEEAVSQNIHFMWLAAMETPDHNTINRFRTGRLKGVFKQIFSQVVMMLVKSGHLDLKHVYTDGTKIESRANRYTFVWGRSIKTSRDRIATQLEDLWQYAEGVAAEELQDNRPTTFENLSPEEVKKTVDKINKAIKDKPVDKKIKQKLNYAKKNWPGKLKEYQQKEKILGNRNSYSKTDPDATFMRMKEDHMNNSQLKPGYNVQISTQNQFIAHYGLHQNPTDTRTLKPHMESFEKSLGTLPRQQVADAGYGSEENLDYLEKKGVEAYIKHNYFDREQKKGIQTKGIFHPDNLYYNKEKDCYYCPMGQQMSLVGIAKIQTKDGYEKELFHYRAVNCQGCPLRAGCHKSKNNRTIEVSHRLRQLKGTVTNRLLSKRGVEHRRQRSIDVEPVFGMIKSNRGFKRFLTFGLDNVSIEFGLLALAHNLKKVATVY